MEEKKEFWLKREGTNICHMVAYNKYANKKKV